MITRYKRKRVHSLETRARMSVTQQRLAADPAEKLRRSKRAIALHRARRFSLRPEQYWDAGIVGRNTCGVYLILHKPSGFGYIGSSVHIVRRIGYHRNALDRGHHPSPRLQELWTRDGKEAFEAKVLECCSKEGRWLIEDHWLAQWAGKLLNNAPTASGAGRRFTMTISVKERKRRSVWMRKINDNNALRRLNQP
jgi:hypothetical protein